MLSVVIENTFQLFKLLIGSAKGRSHCVGGPKVADDGILPAVHSRWPLSGLLSSLIAFWLCRVTRGQHCASKCRHRPDDVTLPQRWEWKTSYTACLVFHGYFFVGAGMHNQENETESSKTRALRNVGPFQTEKSCSKMKSHLPTHLYLPVYFVCPQKHPTFYNRILNTLTLACAFGSTNYCTCFELLCYIICESDVMRFSRKSYAHLFYHAF